MNQMQHPEHARREDERLLTGHGQFADDAENVGALHVVFVRSTYASAAIRSVDISAALAHPEVLAVLTGQDVLADGLAECPAPFRLPQGDGSFAVETPRPYLVRDRARFVGEPIAMVVAQTLGAAQDASELVMIDYAELPCVVDSGKAVSADAPQLWDDRPGNVAYRWCAGDADQVEAALAVSHHVARLRSHISRVAAAPLEPRSALVYFEDGGRPVLRASHQQPYALRQEVAALMRMDVDALRVIAGDVGGSFGMKTGPLREEMLVFWAAMRLKRALRWTAQRAEAFLSDYHARDVVVTSELGLDAQGHFTALRVHYEVNVGAYMASRSATPIYNIAGISGVYTTPAVAAEVVGIFTNTQMTTAYRGAGRPDATYAIERIIDVAAAETCIDPAELRRRNLIPKEAMPYRTSFLLEYDSGDFESNLDRALALAEYASFAQRREAARQRGMLLGIGIAMPIEMAGGKGEDWATLRAHPDGSVTLNAGSMSVGQGLETAMPRLVADLLGIASSKVHYTQGDTDLLARGRGSGGSSSLALGGTAVVAGVDDLIRNARRLAAELLEASPEDVQWADGELRIVGTDRGITLGALAQQVEARSMGTQLPPLAGGPSDTQTQLAGAGHFKPDHPTLPNGCHICEVEVDPQTGLVTLLRYVAVEDVGRVLNPALVEG
ncbi:MAG: xanthine dehydrogenase family protein molybdopterin-binding subunit, partial [Burkholderiaceae bacterium]